MYTDYIDLFVIIVVFLFGGVLQFVTMTTLSLLLMAVSAASVLAESTVFFREQFEDGGEVLLFIQLYLHYFTFMFGCDFFETVYIISQILQY